MRPLLEDTSHDPKITNHGCHLLFRNWHYIDQSELIDEQTCRLLVRKCLEYLSSADERRPLSGHSSRTRVPLSWIWALAHSGARTVRPAPEESRSRQAQGSSGEVVLGLLFVKAQTKGRVSTTSLRTNVYREHLIWCESFKR